MCTVRDDFRHSFSPHGRLAAWLLAIAWIGPVCAGDQDPAAGKVPSQMKQQAERGGIGPLEVVDE